MHTMVDALQAGRLLELPDNTKERTLQILANMIEAVPSVPAGVDMAGAVMARERSASTALGMGWACPHARLPFDGDLVCAIGWSPKGIDYDTPDKLPVRIVVMYLIPENQKNTYLKEISAIAKALKDNSGFRDLETLTSLNEIRNRLLDLVTVAAEMEGPEARARMIRLETRSKAPVPANLTIAGLGMQPVTIIVVPGVKTLALAQHRELAICLESFPGLAESLGQRGFAEVGNWRVLIRSATNYSADRVVYDCLAIRNVPNTNGSVPSRG